MVFQVVLNGSNETLVCWTRIFLGYKTQYWNEENTLNILCRVCVTRAKLDGLSGYCVKWKLLAYGSHLINPENSIQYCYWNEKKNISRFAHQIFFLSNKTFTPLLYCTYNENSFSSTINDTQRAYLIEF